MTQIQLCIPLQAIICIQLFTKKIEETQWVAIFASQLGLIQTHFIMYMFTGETSQFQQQSQDGKQGQDGISQWQVWQVSMLMPIVQLSTCRSASSSGINKTFIIQLLQIAFWSYAVFLVQDIQLFYISFEGVQIPMYFLIGYYGGRNRKIHAAYQFFLYTLVGSQFLLQGQIIQYQETGTSDYLTQMTQPISESRQYFQWLAFFFAQAIKVPMIPMHIWLPEAHVEAPTAASVQLAAILQKLGSYGQLRYCLPLFPEATKIFTPQVYTMCIIAIIYSSQASQALWDMKKQIAYSSIGHMNIATLAIFTNDSFGISASIYFLISHGIISSAQFLQIGILYDRYHTRTIKYYRGLANIMPIFNLFFLLFTLANIAVPGTSGFLSEFLTFFAMFQKNPIITQIASSAIVQTPAYSLWFYHKISYGTQSPHITTQWSDLSIREIHTLQPLQFFTLFFGIYPSQIFDSIELSCLSLLH